MKMLYLVYKSHSYKFYPEYFLDTVITLDNVCDLLCDETFKKDILDIDTVIDYSLDCRDNIVFVNYRYKDYQDDYLYEGQLALQKVRVDFT